MQLAAAAVKAGKLDLAAEQLTQVAASGDDSIKPIAALRLARVLNDQGKADEALAQLGKINNDAFKAQVAEVRGDILQKAGQGRRSARCLSGGGGCRRPAEQRRTQAEDG